ncbi:MAG TPA: alpha-amylase/4-alpha-glucanotransferase domain-containing protein [Burkholderiales bacterium]
MSNKVSLLFGVHAHQPAGNFAHVIDDAHARCYKPFLETVYAYPEFRLSVHFSGWLLGYLLDRFPHDMSKLHEMVDRGQVEMFGGGDTEPVLASIPECDRRSQLAALADRLHATLGRRPTGAWLTERVWESSVTSALAQSGVRYVTVDDYHFLCAGRRGDELSGYFSTEESGNRLDLFPISEALRYRIPFSIAADAIRYLDSLATPDGAAAAIYFDDIEKLGIWPETYAWVYEKQWLKQFIEGVLASPSIESMLYRDFHGARRSHGVVYLPSTSYIEMNEWTLNADRADLFAALVKQEKDQQRYEQDKPFLRGGIWRNFLSRYGESNWMHKRMQQLSARLEALGSNATARMRELLHLAQANDAYWHGLFGGIYLPHLRRAVWNAIVELESLLDQCAPRASGGFDLDLDGCDEFFIGNGELQAVLRDDGHGAIHELDAYGLRHNFGDTLARRLEHYYRKIRDHRGDADGQPGSGIASAHDRVHFRHAISAQDLEADALPRVLFADRYQDNPVRYARPQVRDTRAELSADGIAKTFSIDRNALTVTYQLDAASAALKTVINLAMPSCDGYLGRYILDADVQGGFGQSFDWRDIRNLTLEDGVLRGRVVLTCSRPVSISASPHLTVSQSEDGFEKIMQAVTLTVSMSRQDAGMFVFTLTVDTLPD